MGSSSNREQQQQFQKIVLDTCTTGFVGSLLVSHPEWFNPWNLSWKSWIIGFAAIRVAITFYDHLVVFLLKTSGYPLLPTRTIPGKPVRYVDLDTLSYIYFSINSLHEWIFVQNLCYFVWYDDDDDDSNTTVLQKHIYKEISEIGLMNTILAIYVMFIVQDFIYAPIHHLLHQPWCYPLIHKHHHRQHYPTRGYLDAGNEHPIEHFVGVTATWGAIYFVSYTIGVHALVLMIFFNIHAALAMLNHSPFDVEWNILGIHYSVGNHEMHHRKFTVNYAQYVCWYDYAMQTYAHYEGPTGTGNSTTEASVRTKGTQSHPPQAKQKSR